MAAATSKIHCVTCEKEKVIYKCEGCVQNFCLNHLVNHHELLIKQLDEIENQQNLFRQTLSEQSDDQQKHSLIQQINQWEKNSIQKIQQTAEEVKQVVIKHTSKQIKEIEIRLTKLTEELKVIRQEDDFNEIHLNQLKEKLNQLEEQLKKPSTTTIVEENSSAFINKISVLITSVPEELFAQNINITTKRIENGLTVAGGNGRGNAPNQLNCPLGVCVDDDQTIYVADISNHRIVEWKKGATTGQVVAGGQKAGNRNDQLNCPVNVIMDKKNDSFIICDQGNQRVMRWSRRNAITGEILISNVDCTGISMDNDGYIYVSDVTKHEVKRWKIGETNGGTLVAGGNGAGNRLDQLNQPNNIFVDQDYSVYVSEYGNHRVVKWAKGAKEGIVVAGGHGQGNSLTQLSHPRGIVVDQLGNVYVADQSNHRVMRWSKEATEGSVVFGGKGAGGQTNQLHTPVGLSFDRQNNLYIIDYNNHRIQKFNIESR